MDSLRKNILRVNGGNYNRTEAYEPSTIDFKSNLLNSNSTSEIFTKVPNVSVYPYNVTCRIKYDNYGDTGTGTGFLVGPRLLLTAAHCVMNEDDGNRNFADWKAYPGYSNGSSYKGISTGWSKIYYLSSWKSNNTPEDDWCLVLLNDSIGS